MHTTIFSQLHLLHLQLDSLSAVSPCPELLGVGLNSTYRQNCFNLTLAMASVPYSMLINFHLDGYQASSSGVSEKIFGKGQRKVPSPFFTGVSTFYAHAGLESHLVLFIGLMCCGPRPVQRRVGSDLLAKTCCQPCDPQHTFAHPQ